MTDDQKRMVLTFDDGPSDETNEILDCLEEHGVTATFFVIGRHVAGREATLRRITELGCEIANHGFTHTFLSELDDAAAEDDLRRCSDAIEGAVGQRPSLMRAPKGELGPTTVAVAEGLGLTTVLWSIVTADWTGLPAEDIIAAISAGARPGEVVICHDGSLDGSRQTNTVTAIRAIVPELLADGYQLTTFSELLDHDSRARAELVAH